MSEIKLQRRQRHLPTRWTDAFDRFFDNWIRDVTFPEWTAGEKAFVPEVDVVEKEDALLVKADLPGMTKDDIEITVQNGVLTLTGEKKHEREYDEGDVHRVERSCGRFQRSIALPDYVDFEKTRAGFKDGVLTLTMPKTEEHKPKQIEIE